MPKVTLHVIGEELARELTHDMDTVSLGYFIHALVAGMPTKNLEYLLLDLQTVLEERKDMEGTKMDDAMMPVYRLKAIIEQAIEGLNDEGWHLTEDSYTGMLKLVGPWDSRFQRPAEINLWDEE